MPLLDAALAFALTMLVVATAVTAIMRVIVRFFRGLRQRKLMGLLADFFDRELEPVVKTELARLGDKVETKVTAELAAKAQGLRQRLRDHPEAREVLRELGFNEAEAKELFKLSSAELIERLKRTEIGQTLVSGLKEDAEPVFQKLEARYQVLGEQVTEVVRKYSRWASTAVAMVLAFAVNIDSIHLISTYMSQDEVRAHVVGQLEAISNRHQAPAAEEPTTADLATTKAAIRQEIAALEAQGFPIGWPRFPQCAAAAADHRCAAVSRSEASVAATGQFWTWVLGCLLTGILAGLGAPFWWDVITGIAKTAQTFRGARAAAAGQPPAAAPPAPAQPTPAPAPQPSLAPLADQSGSDPQAGGSS